MSLFRVAIFDSDSRYLHQFMQYLSTHPPKYLQFDFFSEISFAQSIDLQQSYVALVSIDLMAKFMESANQTEDLTDKVYLLGDYSESVQFPELQWINKYQSVETIISQIRQHIWSRSKQMELQSGKTAEFYGFFPVYPLSGTSMIGLQLALKTSDQKKILYLPLTQLGDLSNIVQERPSQNLSDVLAICHEGKEDQVCCNLSSAVISYEHIDVLPPVSNPIHLLEITSEKWAFLFYQLKFQSTYDIVVIETDILFPGIEHAFLECEKVFYSVKEGLAYDVRTPKFIEWIHLIKAGRGEPELVPILINSQLEDIFTNESPERLRYTKVSELLKVIRIEEEEDGNEDNRTDRFPVSGT